MTDACFCARCHKNFHSDYIVRYISDDDVVYTERDYICTYCGYVNSVYEGEEEAKDWCFTFGFGQKHEGHYHIIRGGREQTKKIMFERFGNKWGFQYSSTEAAGVKRYGLKELK